MDPEATPVVPQQPPQPAADPEAGWVCRRPGGCHSLPWMQWLPQRPSQTVADPEAAPGCRKPGGRPSLPRPPEAAPGCHGAFANFVSVPASDSMVSVSVRSPET